MFLIDIPCKGCQVCSNRSSIVHAVLLTLHAPGVFFIFLHSKAANYVQFSKFFENFILHSVSIKLHANGSGTQSGCFNEKKNRGSKIS
jgi:hypothetical protein